MILRVKHDTHDTLHDMQTDDQHDILHYPFQLQYIIKIRLIVDYCYGIQKNL